MDAVDLTARPWTEIPFAGIGMDTAPNSGPGARRLVPTNRPIQTSPTCWIYTCPWWLGGASRETSPSRPSRVGATGLASGSFGRPFRLGRCLGFSPYILSHDLPLQLSQDGRGQFGQMGLVKGQSLLINREQQFQRSVVRKTALDLSVQWVKTVHQPTNQKAKGGVRRRRETSSLARSNHSCVRNGKRCLKLKLGILLTLTGFSRGRRPWLSYYGHCW
jgi:hypothetical protein